MPMLAGMVLVSCAKLVCRESAEAGEAGARVAATEAKMATSTRRAAGIDSVLRAGRQGLWIAVPVSEIGV